jgi:hypothetical protein
MCVKLSLFSLLQVSPMYNITEYVCYVMYKIHSYRIGARDNVALTK